MICEHCGGNRVVSYPPPACGCPGCGAPVCCQTCCDAHSHGYNREGNLSESTSIPSETDTKVDKSMPDPNAIPKMQAFASMEQMADLRSQLAASEARCAELTAERDAAVDVALKNQFELARVKALVVGAPAVAYEQKDRQELEAKLKYDAKVENWT